MAYSGLLGPCSFLQQYFSPGAQGSELDRTGWIRPVRPGLDRAVSSQCWAFRPPPVIKR